MFIIICYSKASNATIVTDENGENLVFESGPEAIEYAKANCIEKYAIAYLS
jgi:hypothetical protein